MITPEKVLTVLEGHPTLPIDENPGTRAIACDEILVFSGNAHSLFSAASIRAKHGIGDPSIPLRQAISDVEMLAEYWLKWQSLPGEVNHVGIPLKGNYPSPIIVPQFPERVDGVGFRFAAAAIISLLIYDEMSPQILKACPQTCDFDDIRSSYHYLNFPDAGLVEMLLTGQEPARWQEIVDASVDWFANYDLEFNLESYAKIILESQRGNWDAAVEAVKESEELYESRHDMKEDIAGFEPWELPYPKQARGIDLRLSAIMHYCFRENPTALDPLNSIHRWKW